MSVRLTMGDVELMPWPLPIPDVIARATVYRPRVGRKTRTFRSMAEAQQYEQGFEAYPSLPALDCSQAAITGYLDAERGADLYREAREDIAREKAE